MKPIWDPQRYLSKTTLTTAILSSYLASCSGEHGTNDLQVTNGRSEARFSYVVQLRMDNGGTCSGSFVSESLLITAAHCVDKTSWVQVGENRAAKEQIFIHPMWPSQANDWQGSAAPRYDLALVEFAPGTFMPQGPADDDAFASLASRAPEVEEVIKIVGFGNSEITPFDTYCRMRRQPANDGRCSIERGSKVSGSNYSYELLFTFEPDESSLPAQCTNNGLSETLAQTGTAVREFVAEHCEGNLRDRPYRETGVGQRRSGENAVTRVGAGVIIFSGKLSGPGDGTEAASGSGDSGGPMFIKEASRWKLAGITHGGSLIDSTSLEEGSLEPVLLKRSIYVDLFDPVNLNWLVSTVSQHQLDFPGLE